MKSEEYSAIGKLIEQYEHTQSPLDAINLLWQIGYALGIPNLPLNGMLTPPQKERLENLIKLIRFNKALILRQSIDQFLAGQPFDIPTEKEP